MKATLLTELKETDALGVDLARVSGTNNDIIKETLAIYFEILKQLRGSPLLRSVFLGLPQFTQYVNIEIVWDLIAVLREYFAAELAEEDKDSKGEKKNVSNVLAGLLCAFQILEVGAGTQFNVDEKDFFSALYTILFSLFEQKPETGKFTILEAEERKQADFRALLKCLDITFVQKRQLSYEIINAFCKRLAIIQMNLQPTY